MKTLTAAIFAILLLGLFSCSEPQQEQKPAKEKETAGFLKITKKIITDYKEGDTSSAVIEYMYEQPGDYFWQKAVHKDEEGSVTQEEYHVFNDNRLPVEKIAIFAGDTTNRYETEYCPNHLHLLKEKEFKKVDGKEMPVMEKTYTYNENGAVVKEKVVRYCIKPDFKNTEGGTARDSYTLHFFPPAENRPAGEEFLTYFIENRKIWENKKDEDYGKLKMEIVTEIDEEGSPVYFYTSEPDCSTHPSQEWYKVKKNDKGHIITILGFADSAMTKHDESSTKMVFGYNDDGMAVKYEEYKYDPEKKDFTKFHGAKYIDWKESYPPNNFSFTNADIKHQSFCIHREVFNSEETRISHPEEGKIVKEVYYSGYDGEYKGEAENKELVKRVVFEYEKAGK